MVAAQVRRTVQAMIEEGLLQKAPPKQEPKAKEPDVPCLVDNYWISYLHASMLPGVTLNAIYKWVSQGSVNGGEGYMCAEDLLRWLSRDSPHNKMHAAASALRQLLGQPTITPNNHQVHVG